MGLDTLLGIARSDAERAELVWDAATNYQPFEEFMKSFGFEASPSIDDAYRAIEDYRADWLFEDSSPDDEIAGMTYREWMQIYAENQLAGDE